MGEILKPPKSHDPVGVESGFQDCQVQAHPSENKYILQGTSNWLWLGALKHFQTKLELASTFDHLF